MAAAKKRYNEVPETQIPEVVKLRQAELRLQQFKETNQQFFQYLEELVTDYNESLAAASQAVRSKQVSCGPFELYQYKTTYDADRLYELLGREKFLEYGGALVTVETKLIDKSRVEIYIQSNHITAEEVKEFKKESPTYHAPKPLGV